MVPSKSLSSLLTGLPVLALLSLSASALPHPRTASSTAPFKLAVRINSNGIKNIAAADRARVQALQAGGSFSINATNDVTIYTANVGVGSPATYYTLLIDTGSSNTWIGADKAYKKTSTSQGTGHRFFVTYGSGSVYGEEYLDIVTLNSDLVIENQSIGVASASSGLDGLDGLLGIGPVDLTQDATINEYQVLTVTGNLYAQKTISSEVLGVLFFAPAFSDDSSSELTFGGYDASKITGDINISSE